MSTSLQYSPAIYLDLWDAATPTQFDDLRLVRMEANLWRYILRDLGGDKNVTGPHYRTKGEAQSDIYRMAKWAGLPS